MFTDRLMDKEDVVHIQNGVLLSHKRKKFGSFVVMWMDLESVIQSEVRGKQISYINSYVQNLEKFYRWAYLQGSDRDADIKNRHMDRAGRGGRDKLGE